MASINIYVSDDLKARMSKHNNARWSAICREAIEAELSRLESTPKDTKKKERPNWTGEWESESLTALPDTAVVKEFNGTKTQSVPQWIWGLTNNSFEVSMIHLPLIGPANINDLRHAVPKFQILKPGSDWQVAHLHLGMVSIRYPVESSE